MIENTKKRWGVVQRTLHWTIVLVVALQLSIGFKFGQMAADDPQRSELLSMHAGIGLTILVLMLFRLYWRRSHPVPKLPDTLTPAQKWLAHTTHWTIYVLLIGMPVGGYLLVSAYGQPVPFFNSSLPALINENERLQYALRGMHIAGAIALIAILFLHISAALRHAWSLRDGVMERMAPFGKATKPNSKKKKS